MKLKLTMASLLAAGTAAISYAAFGAAPAPSACCNATTTDWPKSGGNYGNQDYSSLTQINKSNIRNLGPAWVIHSSAEPVTSPVAGPGSDKVGQQTTPIVVDG